MQGLDLARYIALVGMVFVKFGVVMVSGDDDAWVVQMLQGRASATFVVLAGVGFGLGDRGKPLTLYIAHILIGMGTLETLGMIGGQSSGNLLTASLVFCVFATFFAFAWSRRFTRGPLELAMRRVA